MVFLALLWSGCSNVESAGLPTLVPTERLPTLIALTVEAGEAGPASLPPDSSSAVPAAPLSTTIPTTPIPFTESPTPWLTFTPAADTPTPSLTPTPGLPPAVIQILNPGPASKIISPLSVSAYLDPGAKGMVHIELLGEDGRLLVRKIVAYATGRPAHLYENLEFEINGAAEAGRLQISTEDSHGRMNALASVDLLLLSMGSKDINPPGDLLETIDIQQPSAMAFIQGGTLTVYGLARPVYQDPLIVDLIGADGLPVGPTRLFAISPGGSENFSAFSIEMPYKVSAPTWALLVIAERGGRIPGVTHLSSREVMLSP